MLRLALNFQTKNAVTASFGHESRRIEACANAISILQDVAHIATAIILLSMIRVELYWTISLSVQKWYHENQRSASPNPPSGISVQ